METHTTLECCSPTSLRFSSSYSISFILSPQSFRSFRLFLWLLLFLSLEHAWSNDLGKNTVKTVRQMTCISNFHSCNFPWNSSTKDCMHAAIFLNIPSGSSIENEKAIIDCQTARLMVQEGHYRKLRNPSCSTSKRDLLLDLLYHTSFCRPYCSTERQRKRWVYVRKRDELEAMNADSAGWSGRTVHYFRQGV